MKIEISWVRRVSGENSNHRLRCKLLQLLPISNLPTVKVDCIQSIFVGHVAYLNDEWFQRNQPFKVSHLIFGYFRCFSAEVIWSISGCPTYGRHKKLFVFFNSEILNAIWQISIWTSPLFRRGFSYRVEFSGCLTYRAEHIFDISPTVGAFVPEQCSVNSLH